MFNPAMRCRPCMWRQDGWRSRARWLEYWPPRRQPVVHKALVARTRGWQHCCHKQKERVLVAGSKHCCLLLHPTAGLPRQPGPGGALREQPPAAD